mmetsp:Transcript_3041/g.8393  ORF Transcript_3041/g.8393 Transcript_3041/m.8393 type:complete len:289 (+) Transcript_3041:1050-1916(+)
MRGHKVDTLPRLAPASAVDVFRAAYTLCKIALRSWSATNKCARRIAKLAVPLAPHSVMRKRSDEVKPGAVPRFCNKLDVAKRRVLRQALYNLRMLQRLSVHAARQGGRKVKPKPIDTHLQRPVSHARMNQLGDRGMVCVNSVATARVIAKRATACPHVIHAGGQRFHPIKAGRQTRAWCTKLGRMIVHDVDPALNPSSVKLAHHDAEFVRRREVTRLERVAVHRREVMRRRIAPILRKTAACHGVAVAGPLSLVEFEHRQKLHNIDAKIFEVGYFLDDTEKSAGRAHA